MKEKILNMMVTPIIYLAFGFSIVLIAITFIFTSIMEGWESIKKESADIERINVLVHSQTDYEEKVGNDKTM